MSWVQYFRLPTDHGHHSVIYGTSIYIWTVCVYYFLDATTTIVIIVWLQLCWLMFLCLASDSGFDVHILSWVKSLHRDHIVLSASNKRNHSRVREQKNDVHFLWQSNRTQYGITKTAWKSGDKRYYPDIKYSRSLILVHGMTVVLKILLCLMKNTVCTLYAKYQQKRLEFQRFEMNEIANGLYDEW